MNPLISIVIPTFNREKVLKRAIDSVISQTYEKWELIIVDNCSIDGTKKLVDSYFDSKINIISVENKGVIGLSRNLGIRKANGDLIAFLDSDDWWESIKLERILNDFDESTDIIYHDCYIITESRKKNTNCRVLKGDVLTDLVINGNTLVNSSVVVKNKCLNEVGGFSEEEEIIGWEDYHLWLKLARSNFRFKKTNGELGFCWQGGENFDNPGRVLFNISNIKKHFQSEYSNNISLKNTWWMNYAKGKAHMKLGNKKHSLKEFTRVVINRSPIIFKLKSVYFMIQNFING